MEKYTTVCEPNCNFATLRGGEAVVFTVAIPGSGRFAVRVERASILTRAQTQYVLSQIRPELACQLAATDSVLVECDGSAFIGPDEHNRYTVGWRCVGRARMNKTSKRRLRHLARECKYWTDVVEHNHAIGCTYYKRNLERAARRAERELERELRRLEKAGVKIVMEDFPV